VRTVDDAAVEALLNAVTLIPLGTVTAEPTLQVTIRDQSLVDLSVKQIVNAWKPQV